MKKKAMTRKGFLASTPMKNVDCFSLSLENQHCRLLHIQNVSLYPSSYRSIGLVFTRAVWHLSQHRILISGRCHVKIYGNLSVNFI